MPSNAADAARDICVLHLCTSCGIDQCYIWRPRCHAPDGVSSMVTDAYPIAPQRPQARRSPNLLLALFATSCVHRIHQCAARPRTCSAERPHRSPFCHKSSINDQHAVPAVRLPHVAIARTVAHRLTCASGLAAACTRRTSRRHSDGLLGSG